MRWRQAAPVGQRAQLRIDGKGKFRRAGIGRCRAVRIAILIAIRVGAEIERADAANEVMPFGRLKGLNVGQLAAAINVVRHDGIEQRIIPARQATAIAIPCNSNRYMPSKGRERARRSAQAGGMRLAALVRR